MELNNLIDIISQEGEIISATLSNPQKSTTYKKVVIKPIIIRDSYILQFAYITEKNLIGPRQTGEEAVRLRHS